MESDVHVAILAIWPFAALGSVIKVAELTHDGNLALAAGAIVLVVYAVVWLSLTYLFQSGQIRRPF